MFFGTRIRIDLNNWDEIEMMIICLKFIHCYPYLKRMKNVKVIIKNLLINISLF